MKKKVMVIGAGPAGMEFAIAAARRGHAVTVFEKGAQIGGSLQGYAARDLARPDDLASVIRHYEVMAGKLGIDVRLNTEANAKLMRSLLHQFDACIVASGARIDMDAYRHLEGAALLVSAEDVATGRVVPGRRVVVIGGGKIGLVLAESLRKGGAAEVTVVEQQKRVAGDVMPSFKWRHNTWVEELEIRTLTSSRVTRITAEGVTVADGKGEVFVPAETVIAATPRKSNQELFQEFEWMIDELHGCGDALIPRGLDAAIAEGYRLGARI